MCSSARFAICTEARETAAIRPRLRFLRAAQPLAAFRLTVADGHAFGNGTGEFSRARLVRYVPSILSNRTRKED